MIHESLPCEYLWKSFHNLWWVCWKMSLDPSCLAHRKWPWVKFIFDVIFILGDWEMKENIFWLNYQERGSTLGRIVTLKYAWLPVCSIAHKLETKYYVTKMWKLRSLWFLQFPGLLPFTLGKKFWYLSPHIFVTYIFFCF